MVIKIIAKENTMFKAAYYIILSVTLTMLYQFGLAGDNGNSTCISSHSIVDSETALDIALDYTGFDKTKGFSRSKHTTSTLKSINAINIPYLNTSKNTREIWQIQFKDILVGQQTTKTALRDFEVLLDKHSGKLLRILSISETEGSSDTLPQPSKEAAEEFFNERKYQYKQLPDSMYNVTFWEALQKVRIANPATSKVIKSYYWEFDEDEHSHRWLIIQRGIENPIPSSHGGQPQWLENFMMSCIDAKSGKSLFATNAPFDKNDIINRREREKK